ncbi:Anaphase-promoting complex subunit like [Actinidia chinensis var. chinensis]|uniref:Anaphase-promoting complex subunit like n=1 Tax=Actinidia chinensis var. chinensis TaxID=1590841 RepID=A0A2R6RR84_ACTCC|nr:Anaphase-promoting complex subunit like [Actinidia chinensis var. chinensis]
MKPKTPTPLPTTTSSLSEGIGLLSPYTMLGFVEDQVTSGASTLTDSLFISSLKIALAYNEALLIGRLSNSRGSIIQSTFLGSLRKRVETLLRYSPELENDLHNYSKSGRWPDENSQHSDLSTLLSWHVQWYNVPPPSAIKTAVEKIKPMRRSASVPLLRLLFPRTHINTIKEIDSFWFSSEVDG